MIDGRGRTGRPVEVKRWLCARVASSSAASISAKPLPMHIRWPPPKGKYAYAGSALVEPSLMVAVTTPPLLKATLPLTYALLPICRVIEPLALRKELL